MFRDLARKKQALSLDECIELLKNETRGVLSVIADEGYPYGMPMNHFYDQCDNCIYFHCGKKGHRVDALKKNPKASFCVYDQGYRKDGEWAFNVKSVIVFGRVEMIDDRDKVIDIAARLSRKFTDDEEYIRKEIDSAADRTLLLMFKIEHICGKSVSEA